MRSENTKSGLGLRKGQRGLIKFCLFKIPWNTVKMKQIYKKKFEKNKTK
jgi:hypothetical protein